MPEILDFERLRCAWKWRPIANCAGRHVLVVEGEPPTLAALVGPSAHVESFERGPEHDTVLVVRFVDGGVLAYRRRDGTLVHTLNDVAGLARKLDDLGIEPNASR